MQIRQRSGRGRSWAPSDMREILRHPVGQVAGIGSLVPIAKIRLLQRVPRDGDGNPDDTKQSMGWKRRLGDFHRYSITAAPTTATPTPMRRPTTKSDPRTGTSNFSVKKFVGQMPASNWVATRIAIYAPSTQRRPSPRREIRTGWQQDESHDERNIGIAKVVDKEHRSAIHRQELRGEQEHDPGERAHQPQNPLQKITGDDRQDEARGRTAQRAPTSPGLTRREAPARRIRSTCICGR